MGALHRLLLQNPSGTREMVGCQVLLFWTACIWTTVGGTQRTQQLTQPRYISATAPGEEHHVQALSRELERGLEPETSSCSSTACECEVLYCTAFPSAGIF